MKTSESIEAQEERKAARDNNNAPGFSPANTQPVRQESRQRDASRISAWRWKPGQSGNPSGRPRHDLAAEIAKAIFENNPELIYKAYAKAVAKGNAYAYQVLAERAYGKLRECIQHEISPYREVSDEDLRKRIDELERELGISSSTPELLPPPSEIKPN
jgi:Family of unknown function (DUF5681)